VRDSDPAAPFAASYARVAREFPQVTFVKEKGREDFAAQLHLWLDRACDTVMFAVDDIVVYRALPLGEAVAVLREDPLVATFHFKLSPGIVYCHTADALLKVPPMTRYRSGAAETGRRAAGGTVGGEGTELSPSPPRSSVLLFDPQEGSHDWCYPWDMCCSLYRRGDAAAILALIDATMGPGHYGHPNTLEANGHKALLRLRALPQQTQQTQQTQQGLQAKLVTAIAVPEFSGRPQCACMDRPVLSVVTINRVQSLFCNPVYAPVYTPAMDGGGLRGGRDGIPRSEAVGGGAGEAGRAGKAGKAGGAAESAREKKTEEEEKAEEEEAGLLLELDACLHRGEVFNLDFYRNAQFDSVHIGDLCLTTTASSTAAAAGATSSVAVAEEGGPAAAGAGDGQGVVGSIMGSNGGSNVDLSWCCHSPSSPPLVTVLMPVYNAVRE
jgi:hypothetical protein